MTHLNTKGTKISIIVMVVFRENGVLSVMVALIFTKMVVPKSVFHVNCSLSTMHVLPSWLLSVSVFALGWADSWYAGNGWKNGQWIFSSKPYPMNIERDTPLPIVLGLVSYNTHWHIITPNLTELHLPYTFWPRHSPPFLSNLYFGHWFLNLSNNVFNFPFMRF